MPPSTDTPRPSSKKGNPPSKTPSRQTSSTSTPGPADDPPISTNNPRKIRAPRGPNAKWSDTDIDSLIIQLLQAKEDGNTAEGGFKSAVWKAIADSYDDPLKKKDRAAESKWTRLKKEYKDIKWLREEVSGFGWDNENQLVSTTDEVWEELEKVISYYYY
jgi:hypothetical protein